MKENVALKAPVRRSSNIELLRIIAMVMIVAHHISVHSGFVYPSEIVSFTRLWVQLLQLGGKIGVNIFVLISGYFLITSSSVKTNKVIKLWLQIFTYSAGIFLMFVLFGSQPLSKGVFLKNLAPVTHARWWFASSYFVLYLLSPFINRMLNSFGKKEYQRFLVLLFLCWCIVPTLFNQKLESNPLLWFVFVYSLAGYVRLHADVAVIRSRRCILGALAVMAFTYSLTVLCDLLGRESAFFASHTTYLHELQTLPVLLSALLMFVGFANSDMRYIPAVNTVASATFGVYLIHDNGLLRPFLWGKVFKNAAYKDTNLLIPYTLMVIVAVFAACTLVELFRKYIIERAYAKAIDSLSVRLDKCLNKFFSSKLFDKL